MTLLPMGFGENGTPIYTYETGAENNPYTRQPVDSGYSEYQPAEKQDTVDFPKGIQAKIRALLNILLFGK